MTAGGGRNLYPIGFSPASISGRRGPREGGRAQFFAERRHWLIGGKTGAVGGDLEQDAIGLAEIQAAEIEPVDLAGVADVEFVQPLRPGFVLGIVRGAEC